MMIQSHLGPGNADYRSLDDCPPSVFIVWGSLVGVVQQAILQWWVAVMVTDRWPCVVSTAKMFIVFAAVLYLGERTDPVDEASVRHIITNNTTRTCRQTAVCTSTWQQGKTFSVGAAEAFCLLFSFICIFPFFVLMNTHEWLKQLQLHLSFRRQIKHWTNLMKFHVTHTNTYYFQ